MVQSALVAGRRDVTTCPRPATFRPGCEDAHSPEIPGKTAQRAGRYAGPKLARRPLTMRL